MNEKLDRLLEAVARMEPRINHTSESVTRLENAVRDIELRGAKQEERVEQIAGRMSEHITDHWKFPGAVGAVVTTGLGVIGWLTRHR